jgi:hypothetical protein
LKATGLAGGATSVIFDVFLLELDDFFSVGSVFPPHPKQAIVKTRESKMQINLRFVGFMFRSFGEAKSTQGSQPL